MSTEEKTSTQELLHVLLSGSIPKDILDDLSSRFIINVPAGERNNPIRICFQIELAHWFYLDFYCPENAFLKPCGMREFAKIIFNHVPSLKEHADRVDDILNQWREYKMAVPTYGAIMLDGAMENVILVQSYFAKASWGFPKGKVNQEEEPHTCAVREVLEETGFDIGKLINKNNFIEHHIREQLTRLYIIVGVPSDFQFKPMTRNEIKGFKWFPVSGLPASRRDVSCKAATGFNPNAFFMVIPFIRNIRKWIAGQLKLTHPTGVVFRRQRSKTTGDVSANYPSVLDKSLQQQSFASACQNSYAEFIQAANEVSSKPTAYSPPPRMLKLKGQKALNQKKVQECSAKKSSAQQFFNTNFRNASTNEKLPEKVDREHEFSAPSWTNFKFNRAAILSAFHSQSWRKPDGLLLK